MNPAIRVKDVTKSFRYWTDRPNTLKTLLVDTLRGRVQFGERRKSTVLEKVSFDIYPGEFVGIMGRNGSGKSTLLKLISGIYSPTEGTIEVSAPIAPLIEVGAGFSPDLSGYENIFLNSAILGLGQKATYDLVPAIIDFSELGEKIYMPIKNYSSGMLVRLGFAIASHIPSPIILIDEILAVGDAGFQDKCIAKIRSLHAEGRTIILITHSPNSVKEVCQRCIVIEDKKKIHDGDVDEGIDIYLKTVHTRADHT